MNKIQGSISRGIEEMSATVMDMKHAGVENLTTHPLDSSICPVQRDDRSGRMTVDYLSFTGWWLQLQLLDHTVFHRLNNLTHSLVPGMQLLIWWMLFSSSLVKGPTQSSSLSSGKAFLLQRLISFPGLCRHLIAFPFHKLSH